MNEGFKNWLGGLLDGDGTFTISLTIKNNSILVTPNIRIGLKSVDGWILDYIHKESNIGKIYESNKGKDFAVKVWQTTNVYDSLELAKIIVPYTKLKTEKGKKFIEICELIKNTDRIHHSRQKGSKSRTKQEIIEIVKGATHLNPDRQSVRFRDYKDWDWWKKTIDRLYG